MEQPHCNNLQELDHLFRKLVRKFIKERDKFYIEGISLPGFLILRKIYESGEQRLSDLAEELDLTSGAITAQCDKLEESGNALRVRYREDRRTVYLGITEEGKAFLQRYEELGQIHSNVLFDGFTAEEAEQQLQLIRKLLTNVESMSGKIQNAIERTDLSLQKQHEKEATPLEKPTTERQARNYLSY